MNGVSNPLLLHTAKYKANLGLWAVDIADLIGPQTLSLAKFTNVLPLP